MTRHRTSVRSVLAVVLAPLLLVGLLALPAAAEPPSRLDEPVTDRAGVLDDPGAVRDAIDRLADETRLDLFVVLVETFQGGDRDAWALETAELTGLGDNDVLLAVAVEDRDYWMGSGSTDLSQDQFDTVQYDMVEPELADDAWDAAAIAAADGLRQAATGDLPGAGGGDGDAGTGGGGGGGGSGGASGFLVVLGIGLLVIVVVAVVAALAARRAGSRKAERPGARPEGLEALPTEELNRRASRALVALDDAVTASRQELGFAQAQFGLEATRQFDEVLQHAVGDLREAFTLRQRLDDAEPETEPQRRAMLIEILRRCERADTALDAEVEEFDRLRDLQARAPQVLDELGRRVDEIRNRVPSAQGELERLRTRYSAAALASVVDNPAQAVALLDSAADLVAEGRDAVAADDRAAAVARARAAEDAVGQAVTLLDATGRAGEELAQAGTRIDEGIRSLRSDLADAARLAPDDPAVRAAVVEAEKAVAEAPTERDDGDPLAALRHLTDAETALDAALEPAREQEEADQRARAQLRGLLARVDAQIRGVADFIETRRGAVGPEARTRLAEASRHAQEAHMLAPAEPRAALGEAQQAERLALQAQQLAQHDLDDWTRRRPPGGGPGGLDVGSLILGGILLGGGGRGGGFGGGFGGGGFGGGGGGFSGGGGGFGGGGGGFSGGGGRF